MVVQFGSTVLVPGGSQGILGLRINGDQVTDQASFLRAIATTYFARGNKSTDFQFDAWWFFNTRGLAENFIMSHWSSLATDDILIVTCGDGEGQQFVYSIADAVLQGVNLVEWKGSSVRMHYTFKGGLFTTDSITPPNEDSLIKRGTVALGIGDTSAVIAFSSSFGGKPVVVCRVNRPTNTGDSVVDWDAPDAQVTPGGFTAGGQAIPSAGYILSWVAIAP